MDASPADQPPPEPCQRRSNPRRFGVAAGSALLLSGFCIWLWKASVLLPAGMGIAGAALAVVGLAAPRAVRPIEKAWMALAYALGRINTHVLLLIVFYGMFTPISLVLRLLGRDAMRRRWRDSRVETYWIPRDPHSPDRDGFRRQF